MPGKGLCLVETAQDTVLGTVNKLTDLILCNHSNDLHGLGTYKVRLLAYFKWHTQTKVVSS